MAEAPPEVRRKWSRKKHAAPTHVWYGARPEDLPYKKLGDLDPGIFASYSGPDCGLQLVHDTILEKQKNGWTGEEEIVTATENSTLSETTENSTTPNTENSTTASTENSTTSNSASTPNGNGVITTANGVRDNTDCNNGKQNGANSDNGKTDNSANAAADDSNHSTPTNSSTALSMAPPAGVKEETTSSVPVIRIEREISEEEERRQDEINFNITPVPELLAEIEEGSCAGCLSWNNKNRKAYGICMSLYDQHPIKGSISGDPIADSFALVGRRNNALLVVADGVNWGEKSKLAARCAVYGAVTHLQQQLFYGEKTIRTTYDAFQLLIKAFEAAHGTILALGGGLTTLCAALVCPLPDPPDPSYSHRQSVVCVLNVGDSLAFVFSRRHGVREITVGSHDITSERDIRDAGGALGPVNGREPELRNLTCSMSIVDRGDIVFLTTDGISDNFDPVVTKIAVARPMSSDLGEELEEIAKAVKDGKPQMEPKERHQYAVKEMERIIHEFELFTEQSCAAQELCGALLQHVLKLTDSKRKVLENPNLFGRKMRAKERKKVDSEIVAAMAKAPGKLDHATVIAYEVGLYEGSFDGDEDDDDAAAMLPAVSDEEFSVLEEPRSPGTSSPYLAAVAKPEEFPDQSGEEDEEEDGRKQTFDVSPTFVIPVMCSYQYEERFKSFKYIDSDEDEAADEHVYRR